MLSLFHCLHGLVRRNLGERHAASVRTINDKMVAAARNDYDLRRTMEAAAMSGKKKAIKLQKERH